MGGKGRLDTSLKCVFSIHASQHRGLKTQFFQILRVTMPSGSTKKIYRFAFLIHSPVSCFLLSCGDPVGGSLRFFSPSFVYLISRVGQPPSVTAVYVLYCSSTGSSSSTRKVEMHTRFRICVLFFRTQNTNSLHVQPMTCRGLILCTQK